MKDDDLRRHLQKLKVPEVSESVRARARHRAVIAFQQDSSMQQDDSAWKGVIGRLCGAFALVLAVGLLPFLFFKHHPISENLASDQQILLQVEKLFPGQVNAVVTENGKVDLSIAQSPVIGSNQPVLIVFKRGSDTIRVLSYSGHRVCLMLGKTHSCFEILVTPTGSVILESENKVWLASEHPKVAGYSVRAQTLETTL
ncbi:MAG: hypothetical protein PHD76_06605 [Methylacidiphilales bacterium]|nr:hypothetical protein [Candidatus Methylacidiphilales bacterium]